MTSFNDVMVPINCLCAHQTAQAVQAQAHDKTGVVPMVFKLLVLASKHMVGPRYIMGSL